VERANLQRDDVLERHDWPERHHGRLVIERLFHDVDAISSPEGSITSR